MFLKKFFSVSLFALLPSLFPIVCTNTQTLDQNIRQHPVFFSENGKEDLLAWVKKNEKGYQLQVSVRKERSPWSNPTLFSETTQKIYLIPRGLLDVENCPMFTWIAGTDEDFKTLEKTIDQLEENISPQATPESLSSQVTTLAEKIQKIDFYSLKRIHAYGWKKERPFEVLKKLVMTPENLQNTNAGIKTLVQKNFAPYFPEAFAALLSSVLNESKMDFDEPMILKTPTKANPSTLWYGISQVETHKPYSFIGCLFENFELKNTETVFTCKNSSNFPYLDSFVMNQKQEGACLFEDDDYYILTRDNNRWSDPLLLTTKETDSFSHKMAMDELGNLMVMWLEKTSSATTIKAKYKPRLQEWQNTVIVATVPNGKIKKVKLIPNDQKYFVAVWNHCVEKKSTIWGAAFSFTKNNWSEPKLLSPAQDSCPKFYLASSKSTHKAVLMWKKAQDNTNIFQISDIDMENF